MPLYCKFRYFSRICLNSAWIQHEFNTNVMQNVAQSVVKRQGKNEISMNPAWIQHEFDMNSTPASPQPNLHQNLGKNLQFNTKSQNHWKCMNSAWIWHESDMTLKNNVTRLNMHEFSMNSTWFNTMLQPKYILKLPKFSRFAAAFWIGGLDLESKKSFLTYFREMHESSMNPAWIQHEWSFQIFWLLQLQTTNPNHHSNKSGPAFLTFFEKTSNQIHAVSCRIHAEFMHIQTCNIIFPFMSESCQIHGQIHAEFMHFSMILRFGVELEVFFQDFGANLVGQRLGVEFMSNSSECMLNSCWFHVYLEVSQGFAQHFAWHWCWIHAEFMLNSSKTVKNT